jgi:hypothetical protein
MSIHKSRVLVRSSKSEVKVYYTDMYALFFCSCAVYETIDCAFRQRQIAGTENCSDGCMHPTLRGKHILVLCHKLKSSFLW